MTAQDRPAPRPRNTSREPELLRASSFADLLAAVPSMIGLHPEECLVVVPFLGRRAGGGFRIPLPRRMRRAEIDVLARGCVRVMESMPQASAALAVVYTGSSYEASRGIPLLDLGRAVVRRLESTHLGIVGVACVAADGWGRYTVGSESRSPRPLAELDDSETGLLARAATPEPLDVTALAELPPVSDADRAVVDTVLDRPGLGVQDIVPLVERWLTEAPTPRREAAVIRILQSPPLRDQTTIQIAQGTAMAEDARRRQQRLLTVQALTGETMDEIVGREMAAEGAGAADAAAAAVLMGTGQAPERERLELATAALARAAALAPRELRPAVLTVLAWCWWARGVSSLAAIHLDEALRIDPSYSMARLYRSVFEARAVPDWVITAASRALDRTAARA